MAAEIRAYVFDAYGTLLDVNAAMSAHVAALGPNAAQLPTWWRVKQLEYSWTYTLMGRYRSFWQLTDDALTTAAALCGVEIGDKRAALMEAFRCCPAFDDAIPALQSLRARGLPTAILSNGDLATLRYTVEQAGLAPHLDHLLSADAAQKFKTAPEVYQLAVDALGLEREQIAFCSSNRWDIAGAASFGFQTSWINRSGAVEEYAAYPAQEILAELAL
ncbi:haloacid dehalogenase type II [Magnetofaba australis]|uniref:(S)-2-haloacid dehalogenase n=1 Tax=Magnetofaba australis IT-1 TaxID=1434232 RepID=A0A1Y2K2D6_9PROT|nr:haloacid dehalogenase type II [Magnetofaba australis]OSM01766.1 putative haloacid dehalogenase [Magnetofaba australis IT-1]